MLRTCFFVDDVDEPFLCGDDAILAGQHVIRETKGVVRAALALLFAKQAHAFQVVAIFHSATLLK